MELSQGQGSPTKEESTQELPLQSLEEVIQALLESEKTQDSKTQEVGQWLVPPASLHSKVFSQEPLLHNV